MSIEEAIEYFFIGREAQRSNEVVNALKLILLGQKTIVNQTVRVPFSEQEKRVMMMLRRHLNITRVAMTEQTSVESPPLPPDAFDREKKLLVPAQTVKLIPEPTVTYPRRSGNEWLNYLRAADVRTDSLFSPEVVSSLVRVEERKPQRHQLAAVALNKRANAIEVIHDQGFFPYSAARLDHEMSLAVSAQDFISEAGLLVNPFVPIVGTDGKAFTSYLTVKNGKVFMGAEPIDYRYPIGTKFIGTVKELRS